MSSISPNVATKPLPSLRYACKPPVLADETPQKRADPNLREMGSAFASGRLSITAPATPSPDVSTTASQTRLRDFTPPPTRCCAARLNALETGCRECSARAAAMATASSGETPERVSTEPKTIASRVRVPVLSNTRVSTVARLSNACNLRTSTPLRASDPAAASMAAGVARDSAHGQVTTSTATATISA